MSELVLLALLGFTAAVWLASILEVLVVSWQDRKLRRR